MLTRDELDGVLEAGGRLIASDGTDLGSIDQLVLDSSGAAPAFVSVRAGFFGIAQRFVPLDGATVDGSEVHVAFDADAVRSAPRVASDRGGLSTDQATELRQHYGLPAEVTSPDAEVGPSDAEITSPDTEVTSPDAEVGPPDAEVRSPKAPALPRPSRSDRPLPLPAPRHHEPSPPPMAPPHPGEPRHHGPPAPPPHPGPQEPRGPRPQR